jgi:predicted secreted protein
VDVGDAVWLAAAADAAADNRGGCDLANDTRITHSQDIRDSENEDEENGGKTHFNKKRLHDLSDGGGQKASGTNKADASDAKSNGGSEGESKTTTEGETKAETKTEPPVPKQRKIDETVETKADESSKSDGKEQKMETEITTTTTATTDTKSESKESKVTEQDEAKPLETK